MDRTHRAEDDNVQKTKNFIKIKKTQNLRYYPLKRNFEYLSGAVEKMSSIS